MRADLVASYGGFILHITFFLSRRFFFCFFFLKERYQHQWSNKKPGMAEVRCLCGHLSGVLFLKKACCLLNLSESAEWRDVLSWTNPDQQRRGCDCRNEQAITREWSISSESVMTCQSWAWGFRERDSERRYEHMDQKKFLIKKLMKEQRNSIEKGKEIQEKRHTLKKKN